MIGDPSGKSQERVMLSAEVIQQNAATIIDNFSSLLDFECESTGAIVVNNADWHNNTSIVDWLRDIGR